MVGRGVRRKRTNIRAGEVARKHGAKEGRGNCQAVGREPREDPEAVMKGIRRNDQLCHPGHSAVRPDKNGLSQ